MGGSVCRSTGADVAEAQMRLRKLVETADPRQLEPEPVVPRAIVESSLPSTTPAS